MAIILNDREYPESFSTLGRLGVPLIDAERAAHQDIRPLRIGLLNLMPTAVMKDTEEQFFFLIGNTPLQIIPELITFNDFVSSDTRKQHLDSFYRKWEGVKKEGLDGLIVSGANLEDKPFEEVTYWDELKDIMDWASSNVASTLSSCWGAHAALKNFYAIDRESYIDAEGSARKMTGVFAHELVDHIASPFTRGLPEMVLCPHSHWKGSPRSAIAAKGELKILLDNDEAGWLLIEGRDGREVYLQGHPEYSADSLKKEYVRDCVLDRDGDQAEFPQHYFPNDDTTGEPHNTWRGTGTIFFHNWINHIYQQTHFDLKKTLM